MKVEIKVPEMGESVNEAVIGTLLKENGAYVKQDDEVVELETDKANQVLAAPAEGVLSLTVAVDDTVTIGQVIGSIETEGVKPPAEEKKEPPSEKAPEKKEPPAEQPPAQKEPPTEEEPAKKAPPAEEKPKKELSGGPGVRHMEEQFIADLQKKEEKAPPAPVQKTEGRETRQRMSRIRQTIADRLVEAQQTTAMLTTFNEVDMTEVMALRSKYKETFVQKHGVKLGFMSWFVKACVAALHEVPAINSYIDANEIVHREYYDVGIAVGTEKGLVVPVVRECDKLSFAEIEQEIVNYAKKARSGKISVDDMRGGGFTITNGGIYGSLLSTPILNLPQSGILGMHAIKERPVAIDGKVEIRPMMYLALSYDHRIVDGEGAVTFLVRVKHYLENPSTFLLDV